MADDDDDVADEDTEEFDEACAAIDAAGGESRRLARFGALGPLQKRKLFREVKRLARGYRREGLGPDELVPRVAQHISKDPEFRSIVGILLLSVLAATVQFFVMRFWERWFSE
jgi:hypothetical protein